VSAKYLNALNLATRTWQSERRYWPRISDMFSSLKNLGPEASGQAEHMQPCAWSLKAGHSERHEGNSTSDPRGASVFSLAQHWCNNRQEMHSDRNPDMVPNRAAASIAIQATCQDFTIFSPFVFGSVLKLRPVSRGTRWQ
jgi:hypothetical protein